MSHRPITLACVGALCLWLVYRARPRRQTRQKIAMSTALSRMKTGDIILFSKRSISLNPTTMYSNLMELLVLFVSYFYRGLDNCEWSHVGVVYRDPVTKKVLLMHSCDGVSDIPDYYMHTYSTGVQVIELEAALTRWHGYFGWRPLNQPLSDASVQQYLQRTYHMGYAVPLGLLGPRIPDRLFDLHHWRQPGEANVVDFAKENSYCTGWVGDLFQYCGAYDAMNAPWNGYWMPSDFSNGFQQHYFSNGWQVLEEWEIDVNE